MPQQESGDPASLSEPQREVRRRAIITRDEVLKAGFTIGCPGCRAISRNAPSQNHTEVCRTRIEEALTAQGGVGAKRVAEGNARYEEHLSKKRQAEAQEEEEEIRKRPAAEGGKEESKQASKQARQERQSAKRALEGEEEAEDENPAKFRQLDDEEDQDEEMQGRSEGAVGGVERRSSPKIEQQAGAGIGDVQKEESEQLGLGRPLGQAADPSTCEKGKT